MLRHLYEAATRQHTFRFAQALRGKVTILLVEHDMDAVFALADRISVLVNGALLTTADPAAVRADPAVRAAYLGGEA